MTVFSIFRRRFFSKEEEKLIVTAICNAELNTSGEIRVHFSKKIVKDVMSDALVTFEKLKMHETERRNGVLIFIVPNQKQFAILGDEGFHIKSGNDFWESVKERMQQFFKDANFVEGLTSGIAEVGLILKEHFPREANDINELNDEISYGE